MRTALKSPASAKFRCFLGMFWMLVFCQVGALTICIREYSDAERIELGERIVIGTLESKGNHSMIHVEEVLKGYDTLDVVATSMKPIGAVTSKVLWVDGGRFDDYSSKLSQLSYIEEGSSRWKLYHALKSPELLLGIDQFPECNEAAKVIGFLFDAMGDATFQDAQVGSLDGTRAADFLRKRLKVERNVPEREREVQISHLKKAALRSLMRMRDRDSVPAITEVLSSDDESLILVAIEYLESARDSRAVQPLCQLLAAKARHTQGRSELCDKICELLVLMNDPRAVPAFEDALKYQVNAAYVALAQYGNVESIGKILDSASNDGLPHGAGMALLGLVLRSDEKFEPWMDKSRNSGSRLKPRSVKKWRKWWVEHQADMVLVRSYDEAYSTWKPPQKTFMERVLSGFYQNRWFYVIGLGVLFGVVMMCRWLIRKSERNFGVAASVKGGFRSLPKKSHL